MIILQGGRVSLQPLCWPLQETARLQLMAHLQAVIRVVKENVNLCRALRTRQDKPSQAEPAWIENPPIYKVDEPPSPASTLQG